MLLRSTKKSARTHCAPSYYSIEALEERRLLTTYSMTMSAVPTSETVTIDFLQNHQVANVAFVANTNIAVTQNTDPGDYINGVQFTLDLNGGSVVAGSITSSPELVNNGGTTFSANGQLNATTYFMSEQVQWDDANRGVKTIKLHGVVSTLNKGSKEYDTHQTITIPAGSVDMPGVSGIDKYTIGSDVLLNNDDDNFDGTPDNHNGYTIGEHDLIPITLHASNAGGRYQLDFTDSGSFQSIKVWAKSDKSASDGDTHIVGGTGVYRVGSDQTILDASVDTTLYVEGFNFGIDTITLRWKSDVSYAPYNTADDIKVNVYGVKLTYQNQDVASAKAANVLIGQFQQITADIYGPADLISNPTFSWTVGSKAYKDYSLNTSPTNPTLTALATGDLNQSAVGYFWTDSGNKNVQCDVTMGGKLYSRVTRFATQAPTATLSTTTGSVVVGQDQAGQWHLQIGQPGADGFTATASVQMPAGFSQGTWAFLQTVTTNEHIHGGGKTYFESNNGVQHLDISFPVPATSVRDAGGQNVSSALLPTGNSSFTFYDTPGDNLSADQAVRNRVSGGYGVPSLTQIDGETRDNNYDTYVMFMPPGTNSKWVPLKTVHWSFKADVSITANNPNIIWGLNSHTDPVAGTVNDLTTPPTGWSSAWQEDWLEV